MGLGNVSYCRIKLVALADKSEYRIAQNYHSPDYPFIYSIVSSVLFGFFLFGCPGKVSRPPPSSSLLSPLYYIPAAGVAESVCTSTVVQAYNPDAGWTRAGPLTPPPPPRTRG